VWRRCNDRSHHVLALRFCVQADMRWLRAAQELVDLVLAKYKNKYDLTIARRNWMGKDFVSLNIMWVHLDQRSFPMSEEDYMDKVDGIAMLLNIFDKQVSRRWPVVVL
jgi:Domain of unknown function (DUF3067)